MMSSRPLLAGHIDADLSVTKSNSRVTRSKSQPPRSKKYREVSKKKRKRRKKKRKKRQQQHPTRLKLHDLKFICVKEHFENKYNCLRLLALFVTAIFFVICSLYTIGSVYHLELQNFWCDKYEWDEIIKHSHSVGSTTGEGGCYVSKLSGADETKLFAKGNNLGAFNATFVIKILGIAEFILYSSLSLFLLFLIINYNYEYCKDCKQLALKKWFVTFFSKAYITTAVNNTTTTKNHI